MKKITPIICSVLLVLLMCNCTGKFEEFNSNQYQPPVLNSRLLFAQLITCMSSTEENPSQRNITFWAGPFGGMLTPTSSWSRSQHFYTYNVDDNWNKWSVDWYFKNFYPNYFSIERFTEAMNTTRMTISLLPTIRTDLPVSTHGAKFVRTPVSFLS